MDYNIKTWNNAKKKRNRRGAVSFRKKGIGTRDYRDYQGDNLYKYYSQVKEENQ